jgi:cardiolipin synthase
VILRLRTALLLLSSSVLVGFAGLSGCTPPPSREQILPRAGARGPDAACMQPLEPDAVERAAPTAAQRNFVCRLDEVETAITRRPLVAGNQVTLLVDGPATHAAQLAAIARARRFIHLSAYIIEGDSIGEKYRDALVERARAGVEVRVMFDSFGGILIGREFREALERAGAEVHEYAPINPIEDPALWRVAQRNHRKLLVVDGRVAFTGGIGISEQYSQSAQTGSMEHGWRDTHIRITGPAVPEFERLFLASWKNEAGPIAEEAKYFPKLRPHGDELVRAVSKEGEDLSDLLVSPFARALLSMRSLRHRNAIYASYLAAISESRSRVWITQAYFAPNREFREALEGAAHRGIDVRLLVPANSDIGLLLHASRHQYADLLESGVRIFEYEGSVLHAKTAVVDGVWSTVGSSNLDYLSFIHNDEANAIVVGHSFAGEMERMFQDDLASAREVTLDEWRARPISDRVKQTLASTLKYWI